jgi:hypothetical protein
MTARFHLGGIGLRRLAASFLVLAATSTTGVYVAIILIGSNDLGTAVS